MNKTVKKIKDTVKKNDYLNILYHTFANEQFRHIYAQCGQNPRLFCFEHLGNENRGKNIYYIQIGRIELGMFALLKTTLRCLEVADRFHFIPVVKWTDVVAYSVPGQSNPFLLFYQPVSDISVESALKSENIAFANSWDRAYGPIAESYRCPPEEIERLSRIYQKYLKLQPQLQSRIDRELSELFGEKPDKVLGVHVRGVDWRKKKIYKHPIAFSEEDYLNKAKEIMKDLGYNKVFLASDSESAVNLFRKEFGEDLIVAQASRTPEGSDLLTIYDKSKNGYDIGFEILLDAYALAACDSLLCGVSNVGYGAQIIRLSIGKVYERIFVMDQGFYESGIMSFHEGKKRVGKADRFTNCK